MSDNNVTLIKAPIFRRPSFWREIFEAAKETNTQVVIINGPVCVQNVSGGGATINNGTRFSRKFFR